MNIEQLARSVDELDRKIRLALPFVADVFMGVTANRTEENLEPATEPKRYNESKRRLRCCPI